MLFKTALRANEPLSMISDPTASYINTLSKTEGFGCRRVITNIANL